jgi:hypothetical protein
MKAQACLMIAVFFAAEATATAHPGPRIWVSIDGGNVTTYAGPYPPGDPSSYHAALVFSQPLADEGGNVWATDFPGLQKVPGGNIPNGKTFNYNIVGPLLWYNPGDAANCPHFETVADRFANSPPVPEMAVTNELFQTKYTSSGFVAGDAAFAYNGGAGDHNHLTYTLLGDGINPEGGPDGIYALQLQLTQAGATPSATFFLLLGKNASTSALTDAMSALPGPRNIADLNCDSVVGLGDLPLFEECMEGPDVPQINECLRADLDLDEDVDLQDYAAFDLCRTDPSQTLEECAR